MGRSNFTMTVEQWDDVNEFVESVGWEFICSMDRQTKGGKKGELSVDPWFIMLLIC